MNFFAILSYSINTRREDSCVSAPVLWPLQEGSWGQICDENFGDADARVSCRQMGFADGFQLHDSRQNQVAVEMAVNFMHYD
eukprot:Skav218292  [mRNA]  locus=scaffold2035:853151:853396:- [translate_table: standard]